MNGNPRLPGSFPICPGNRNNGGGPLKRKKGGGQGVQRGSLELGTILPDTNPHLSKYLLNTHGHGSTAGAGEWGKMRETFSLPSRHIYSCLWCIVWDLMR
jgi:hypothetical protein